MSRPNHAIWHYPRQRMQVGQEDRVTFQCYFPRSSQPSAIRAVFVMADGTRRLIPDHWLAQAELSEHGRLLRLIYGCCTIEVAGQHLETPFQDVLVGRLGVILEGPAVSMPGDQLWVNSIALADAVATFERE